MPALGLAILVFLAISLIAMGVAGRTRSPLQARIRTLATAARSEAEDGPNLERPFVERVVWPTLERLSEGVMSLLPAALLARLRRQLTLAGSSLSVAGLLLIWIASAAAFPGAFLALMLAARASSGSLYFLGFLTFLALGIYVPYFWLARRVGRRERRILRDLPNALDLITTCVEAGLGLDAAFAKVTDKMKGPLSDELAHALDQMAVGRMRRDALRDVGVRTGVPEVVTFVNAVVHAEQTGASIGELLRVQAEQARVKRRQRIEAHAQRMPIWMTFPLVLFILPSLFIVILAPAGISAYEALGG
jgi:tight adherence protein C